MAFTTTALEDDLAAFSDLGTLPSLTAYAQHAEATWWRGGIQYTARFRTLPDRAGLEVELENGSKLAYADFLASPMMADLRSLARQIVLLDGRNRSRSRRSVAGRDVYAYDWYVDSRVAPAGSSDNRGTLASEALRAVVEGAGRDVGTQVVFLTAHAGQGKSSVLQRFNVEQARRYQQSKSSHLSFYVDAQGRGLSQLNEAVALQLNELQFLLPHAAVPVLVREGLITLIVDGFDELIGSRGTYDDAFSSLTNFLELLDGRGKFVAAARSSYFTQEYESRAGTMGGSAFSGIAYEMTHYELLSWDDAEQRQFLANVSANLKLGESASKRLERQFARVREEDATGVLGRPLFCRDVVTMIADGRDADFVIGGGRDLVRIIAGSILEREAGEKLLVERKRVVDEQFLRRYFEELAAEMWQLETRELDNQTARALIEVMLEEAGVRGEALEVIPARVGFMALVADGRSPKSIEFEHEIFFAHFLAGALAATVMTSTDAAGRAALSKAALDIDAADEIARRLAREGVSIDVVVQRLSELGGARHPREAQVRRNCGSLAAAIVRNATEVPPQLQFRSMSFVGESFSGVHLVAPHFDDVQFSRVDLRGAVVDGGTARATNFVEPLIDPVTTRLDLDGFEWQRDLLGLRVADQGGSVRVVYDPTEIASALGEVEVEPESLEAAAARRFVVDREITDLVARLCHAYERMNPIGTKHDRYGDVFSASSWRDVRDALLETGLITEVQRQASGPAQQFFRKHFQPAELMAALVRTPTDPAIDDFWSRVGSLATK